MQKTDPIDKLALSGATVTEALAAILAGFQPLTSIEVG